MGRKRKAGDQLGGLLGSIQGPLSSGQHLQPKSELVDLLVTKYLWGEVPAVLLQQICAAAVKDGLVHPDVETMSRVGTSGLHPGPLRAMTRVMETSNTQIQSLT